MKKFLIILAIPLLMNCCKKDQGQNPVKNTPKTDYKYTVYNQGPKEISIEVVHYTTEYGPVVQPMKPILQGDSFIYDMPIVNKTIVIYLDSEDSSYVVITKDYQSFFSGYIKSKQLR